MGLVIFENFPLGGGWESFGLQGRGAVPFRGTPKSRGGAEDLDKFYKNITENLLKIMYHSGFHGNICRSAAKFMCEIYNIIFNKSGNRGIPSKSRGC